MRIDKVLLISNETDLIRRVRLAVETQSNCVLMIESDGIHAIDRIRESQIDLLIVHQTAEEGFDETLSFLESLETPSGLLPTVVICDSADAAQSAKLIACGVIECLQNPFDVRRLSNLVSILTSRQHAVHDRIGASNERALKRSPRVAELSVDDSKAKFLFNTSGEFADLMEQVRRVAPSMTTILLLGETGVGKTRLANVIHKISPRRDEPFVAVNCGALSPGLIESELLGHVKGAFTGALRDHDGKMKMAGSGTLLLDEIDSLPMVAQASLLRAIDERVFEPVGSTASQRFRARLIVATNRDLEAEVAARRFREDLYYRINVISFNMPPLRDRRELIPSLAEQFLAEFSERDGQPKPQLSEESLTTLTSFDWPGNIRELRNVIERASSLCRDELIFSRDLFANNEPLRTNRCRHHAARSMSDRTTWIHERDEVEIKVIRRALASANNNRARAARELGMSRVTLYKKLHKYDLFDPS